MYAKSATTITNILEAAQKLFVNKNYADVTMAEIADAARVTKGALYHHFDSKEALYAAMMLVDLEAKKQLMHAAVERQGTCRARLYDLTMAFLDLSHDKRQLMKLVRRDINIFKNPVRDQLIRAYQAALPEQVELIILDGMRAGELTDGDARLLAWQYVAMVEVMLSRYVQNLLGNQQQAAGYVLNLFFNGAKRGA